MLMKGKKMSSEASRPQSGWTVIWTRAEQMLHTKDDVEQKGPPVYTQTLKQSFWKGVFQKLSFQ